MDIHQTDLTEGLPVLQDRQSFPLHRHLDCAFVNEKHAVVAGAFMGTRQNKG